jgi:hypothetical protein
VGKQALTIIFSKIRPLEVGNSSTKIGSCFILSSVKENTSVDEDKLFSNDLAKVYHPFLAGKPIQKQYQK